MEKATEERVGRYKSAEASAKAESEVLRKEMSATRDRESRITSRANKAEKALAKATASGSGVRQFSRYMSHPHLIVAQNRGVDIEALEWSVSCHICMEKMWQPWMQVPVFPLS